MLRPIFCHRVAVIVVFGGGGGGGGGVFDGAGAAAARKICRFPTRFSFPCRHYF